MGGSNSLPRGEISFHIPCTPQYIRLERLLIGCYYQYFVSKELRVIFIQKAEEEVKLRAVTCFRAELRFYPLFKSTEVTCASSKWHCNHHSAMYN